jgi:hypothetical protein
MVHRALQVVHGPLIEVSHLRPSLWRLLGMGTLRPFCDDYKQLKGKTRENIYEEII